MARRPPTPVETAARRDLRALPRPYRDGAVGKAYLELARILDAGVPARDAAAVAREMRLCLLTLYDLAPPKAEADFVDEVRLKREKRMREVAAE